MGFSRSPLKGSATGVAAAAHRAVPRRAAGTAIPLRRAGPGQRVAESTNTGETHGQRGLPSTPTSCGGHHQLHAMAMSCPPHPRRRAVRATAKPTHLGTPRGWRPGRRGRTPCCPGRAGRPAGARQQRARGATSVGSCLLRVLCPAVWQPGQWRPAGGDQQRKKGLPRQAAHTPDTPAAHVGPPARDGSPAGLLADGLHGGERVWFAGHRRTTRGRSGCLTPGGRGRGL